MTNPINRAKEPVMPPGSMVSVRVPGSTSNLGSGFDTLGIALSLHNTITVRLGSIGSARDVTICSPVPENVRAGAEAMLNQVRVFFESRTGTIIPAIEVWVEGDVPVARGLGSSVTLRLGLLGALTRLSGLDYSNEILGQWVSEIEGHPDNAMPSALGGFCSAGWESLHGELKCLRVELPDDYCFVTLIPDFEVRTDDARKALPQSYSRADAVRALNRASLVTACFCLDKIEELPGLFDDPVHQPYRGPLIPGYPECMQAGAQAGALGGWISGSGSTLMWLARGNGEKVGRSVHAVMPDAALHFLRVDNQGMTFLKQNVPGTAPTS